MRLSMPQRGQIASAPCIWHPVRRRAWPIPGCTPSAPAARGRAAQRQLSARDACDRKCGRAPSADPVLTAHSPFLQPLASEWRCCRARISGWGTGAGGTSIRREGDALLEASAPRSASSGRSRGSSGGAGAPVGQSSPHHVPRSLRRESRLDRERERLARLRGAGAGGGAASGRVRAA